MRCIYFGIVKIWKWKSFSYRVFLYMSQFIGKLIQLQYFITYFSLHFMTLFLVIEKTNFIVCNDVKVYK